MSDPFLGQITMFGGNFAPRGWAFCNGQLFPIAQHSALFSILGTTYGGDGQTTFGLPDLRGRVPVHQGSGPGLDPVPLGQKGGAVEQFLTVAQLPPHNHPTPCHTGSPNIIDPGGNLLAQGEVYSNANANGAMRADPLGNTGGGQPFSLLQPYQAVSFIIALQGIFPSSN